MFSVQEKGFIRNVNFKIFVLKLRIVLKSAHIPSDPVQIWTPPLIPLSPGLTAERSPNETFADRFTIPAALTESIMYI